MKTHLHFQPFLNTEMVRVTEIIPHVRQGHIYPKWSISWSLMSWQCHKQGHQGICLTHLTLWVLCIEARIFQEIKFNNIAVDVLTWCIAKSPTAMVLGINYTVLVFHTGGFWMLGSSRNQEIIENTSFLYIKKKIRGVKTKPHLPRTTQLKGNTSAVPRSRWLWL